MTYKIWVTERDAIKERMTVNGDTMTRDQLMSLLGGMLFKYDSAKCIDGNVYHFKGVYQGCGGDYFERSATVEFSEVQS